MMCYTERAFEKSYLQENINWQITSMVGGTQGGASNSDFEWRCSVFPYHLKILAPLKD